MVKGIEGVLKSDVKLQSWMTNEEIRKQEELVENFETIINFEEEDHKMNLMSKSKIKIDMFDSGSSRHKKFLRESRSRHPNRTRSQSKRTKTSESLNDEQSEMFSNIESMYSNVTEFQDHKFSNLGTPLKETFETPIKVV